MNVLIVSRDESFLAPPDQVSGDALNRHELYLECLRRSVPGSEIRILILGRTGRGRTHWKEVGNFKIASIGLAVLFSATIQILRLCVLPRSILGSWKPDVVTSQSPMEDGLVALMIARRSSARYVAQLHTQLAQISGGILGLIRRWLCGFVLRRSDVIRFVAHRQREECSNYFHLEKQVMHVAPVAMIFDAFNPTFLGVTPLAENSAPLVTYAGRFADHKNLKRWIAVAAQVARIVPDAHFQMIGDGPERTTIEQLAVESGLNGHIVFHDFIPTRELAKEYQRTTVYLLTSDEEAFGRVVAEAGAYGVPVVSTRCGGPEEIIENGVTGFLRACNDIEGLAKDVSAILTDSKLRDRMSRSAFEHVRANFSISSLTDRIVRTWLP